jgi:hypothetical protein
VEARKKILKQHKQKLLSSSYRFQERERERESERGEDSKEYSNDKLLPPPASF